LSPAASEAPGTARVQPSATAAAMQIFMSMGSSVLVLPGSGCWGSRSVMWLCPHRRPGEDYHHDSNRSIRWEAERTAAATSPSMMTTLPVMIRQSREVRTNARRGASANQGKIGAT
jgi:hypothetical protein